MTKADLLEAMNKADILMYPWALYCNPADEKILKDKIPKTVKLIPIYFVEQGKFLLVDRVKCEKNLLER